MLVIDRFENGFAVCEDDTATCRIPREFLPPQATEGDVLEQKDGAYLINAGATEHRRKAAAQRLKRLLGREDDGE